MYWLFPRYLARRAGRLAVGLRISSNDALTWKVFMRLRAARINVLASDRPPRLCRCDFREEPRQGRTEHQVHR